MKVFKNLRRFYGLRFSIFTGCISLSAGSKYSQLE